MTIYRNYNVYAYQRDANDISLLSSFDATRKYTYIYRMEIRLKIPDNVF